MDIRVLVTGGCGFIGSHLCEALLRRGDEVLCVDNYSTGSLGNIQHLRSNRAFEMVRHDISLPIHLEVRRIFNLASSWPPNASRRDPIQAMKTNVQGAINMLGLAKRTRSPILQASTADVYGDAEAQPQPEDFWGSVDPIGPGACNDEGKRCAETLFLDYRRQHRLQAKVARIFDTYGPRMRTDPGRVVPDLIVQALRSQPLTIPGDGGELRSLCFVDDIVAGLLRLMDSPADVVGPVNLGDPAGCSTLELAHLIVDLTGTRSRPVQAPPSTSRRCRPDIGMARALLGWEPETRLREGLSRTIAWFEEVLSAGLREAS